MAKSLGEFDYHRSTMTQIRDAWVGYCSQMHIDECTSLVADLWGGGTKRPAFVPVASGGRGACKRRKLLATAAAGSRGPWAPRGPLEVGGLPTAPDLPLGGMFTQVPPFPSRRHGGGGGGVGGRAGGNSFFMNKPNAGGVSGGKEAPPPHPTPGAPPPGLREGSRNALPIREPVGGREFLQNFRGRGGE